MWRTGCLRSCQSNTVWIPPDQCGTTFVCFSFWCCSSDVFLRNNKGFFVVLVSFCSKSHSMPSIWWAVRFCHVRWCLKDPSCLDLAIILHDQKWINTKNCSHICIISNQASGIVRPFVLPMSNDRHYSQVCVHAFSLPLFFCIFLPPAASEGKSCCLRCEGHVTRRQNVRASRSDLYHFL